MPSGFVKANQAVKGPVVGEQGILGQTATKEELRGVGVEGNPKLTDTDDAHISEEKTEGRAGGGLCLRTCFTGIWVT